MLYGLTLTEAKRVIGLARWESAYTNNAARIVREVIDRLTANLDPMDMDAARQLVTDWVNRE